ncbi:MAG: GNAT family N-acetyltransferase [Myxococcales bacterium]|nr:GNAT family N-acetyltransferase [Myxococcales bacterium]
MDPARPVSTVPVIRGALPEDVEVIADLVRRLAAYERLEQTVTGTVDDLREHLFGARHYAEVLLADDGDTIAGFALFFHNYSTFLARPGIYLEDLFVVPERRRRGLGRALLVAVARTAVERGCGRLEWSVLGWNEPAIAFYRSLGASLLDEWRPMRVTGGALPRLAALEAPVRC